MKVLLLLLFPLYLWADLQNAPPSWTIQNSENKAVFIDITDAKYQVDFFVKKKKAHAKTILKFITKETGAPIFDLVPNVKKITLNGKHVSSSIQKMGVTQVQVLDSIVPAGNHILEIESEFSENIKVNFWKTRLNAAFWMSDLSDRSYLEKYLPTNLEYDHYKSELEIRMPDVKREHLVYSNGEIQKTSHNHFKIIFPDYFTSSSFYLHIAPKGDFREKKFEYKSIDSRIIPIVAYGKLSMNSYPKKIPKILAELEKDYGPYPHDKVVVYFTGLMSGGMEYAGATATSVSALGHEITHFFFARGVMPVRGNSGWIDEAIARWRDLGYKELSSSSLSVSSMAGHSVFRRHTDKDAYSKGAAFMGYLNGKFKEKGGLKLFLEDLFDRYQKRSIDTLTFQKELELFYNTELDELFKKYIYSSKSASTINREKAHDPYHPILSKKELEDLL